MVTDHVTGTSQTMVVAVRQKLSHLLPADMPIGLLLGPLVGLLIWWLPLEIGPAAHKAFAIVGFMLVYWVTEALDHGMTALIGCFLFWVLQVVPPTIAFSGFTKPTPWFIFGMLLIGKAVSRTGLAKRIGYHVLLAAGSSYTWLLLGVITLVYAVNFLISSTVVQVATLAPLVLGIVAALGLEKHSNVARGLFVILTYSASHFGLMFLSSGIPVLAYGIIAEQTGVEVLWSQWFLAFFPLAIPTIMASWLTIRWLFPPEHDLRFPGQSLLQETEHVPGPWSREERQVLGWLLLGTVLWATDFLHHVSPAAIGIGLGLVLTLPKVGILDKEAVKSVNYPLILFVGGVLSMATVLRATQALDVVVGPLHHWFVPFLSGALPASLTLYWGGFLYHFFAGSQFTMSSTLLPVLLHTATSQAYNPVAVGMLWTFAGGGKLFAYQATSVLFGYSFGIFTARDPFKVGAIMTLVEGLLIMVLVPVYWPLIGLSWTIDPSEQRVLPMHAEAAAGVPPVDRLLQASQEKEPDPEAEAWAFVGDTSDPQDVSDFLAAYPASRFASAARLRLQLLRQPQMVMPLPVAAAATGLRTTWTAQRIPAPDPLHASPLQIRQVQRRLRQAGLSPGPIDGRFGPRTVAALRQYQARYGLAMSGQLDRATQDALRLRGEEEVPGQAGGVAGPGSAAVAVTEPGVPRIYIYIRREEDRGAAQSLARNLHARGFLVPDIERFTQLGPRESQLRFFHKAAAPEAQTIVDVLNSRGIEVRLRHMAGYEAFGVKRPRHYELWFAPDEPREARWVSDP